MNDLRQSRTVEFRYELLNFNETKIGELTSDGGSLGMSSLAQIKRTGSFKFKEAELKEVDWLNDKVRPILIINGEEFPLGVFMISSPTRNYRHGGIYRSVECYDTSLILLEDKFDNRYRIIKDTNYTTAINQILASAGIWKINIPHFDGHVKTDREFEIGTSKLEAINYLLQEINYTSIWVDEIGTFTATPYILPNDRVVELTYKNDNMSVILPDTATEEMDLFSIPNKWVVVATNPETEPLTARYTNNSGGSPTSVVNRKRTIVDFREVDNIAGQGVLDDYVRRIAYEASNVYGKFIFETAIMPSHGYLTALFCEHDKLGISNKYIETSWEMELKAGGKMTHSARRVIQL